MPCPYCGAKKVERRGFKWVTREGEDFGRLELTYRCLVCGGAGVYPDAESSIQDAEKWND